MSKVRNPVTHDQHACFAEVDNSHCRPGSFCTNCGWYEYVPRHSSNLSWKLVTEWFDRTEGSPVTYKVKPGFEKAALCQWWRHGICIHCGHRSITGGTCINCGQVYDTKTKKIIKILKNGDHWYADLRMVNYRDSAFRAASDAFADGADEVVVPTYESLEEDLFESAEGYLLNEPDVKLIANANSIENFTLWAKNIVSGAIIDSLILDEDSIADWFNVYHLYERKSKIAPIIHKVCLSVYEKMRS